MCFIEQLPFRIAPFAMEILEQMISPKILAEEDISKCPSTLMLPVISPPILASLASMLALIFALSPTYRLPLVFRFPSKIPSTMMLPFPLNSPLTFTEGPIMVSASLLLFRSSLLNIGFDINRVDVLIIMNNDINLILQQNLTECQN